MSVYGMCSVCLCVCCVVCVCVCVCVVCVCGVCSDGVWGRMGLKIELKNMLKSEKVNIY